LNYGRGSGSSLKPILSVPVSTLYERVGGEQFFVDLVDRFYLGVAGDPLLRPLYPEQLDEPARHLALFLVQYWGGPGTYSEQRGHPRLRMRHAPFVIGAAGYATWVTRSLRSSTKPGSTRPTPANCAPTSTWPRTL